MHLEYFIAVLFGVLAAALALLLYHLLHTEAESSGDSRRKDP